MKKIIRITTVPISFLKLLPGQLKFMRHFFGILAISSGGRELDQVGINERVEIFPLNMTRLISPLQDIFSLFKLISLFLKAKPQIVHTHTPKAGTLGMLAAWVCRVPVRMHTVAGLPLVETIGAKRILLDTVEMITYSCATRVFPNSYGLKEIILKNKYCVEKKLQVIGNGSSNGIDVEYFSPDSIPKNITSQLLHDLNLTSSHFIFIFVGRLVSDKGLNELVKAFSNVNHRLKNSILLLVGTEEKKLDPLHLATQRAISTNSAIVSVGYKTDIRPYLSISHVLAFPSYREGFPNVVMQAGAMGLPSIVSNINGCNEIIGDGMNGLIIPPKNILQLEEAMIQIFMDNDLYIKLKNNARLSIVDRYDQMVIWNEIKTEYCKQVNKYE